MLKHYKRKSRPPRCTLKIDLRKAYDSLSWEFIGDLLKGLQFPAKFITWVMECMTSPSYTLCINGETCGFFKGRRGLRQGDPISPLLFVIAMEYLTRLLSKMSKKERALRAFAQVSGLQANPSKSAIYYGNVKEDIQGRIQQLTGYSKGNFPFRYLGVPITAKRIAVADCDMLVDRILHRVSLFVGSYWEVYLASSQKEDVLWIKWVHNVYLKQTNWWEYEAPKSASWVWKAICKMKEVFKNAYQDNKWLNSVKPYTVK
ncbi:uncharacterized protein LOC130590212 [Beta vulgaris subsp. vulgaris]|uniref:uncharacterized protein LOC130590212 n=1 Tax=Beta vulgaris subsp. vulgaris TaxID=3555 RepID=UPI00254815DD|nr:uncharacterized protein LOC130590212 [Beta vulgaris subsp. vulgaris]